MDMHLSVLMRDVYYSLYRVLSLGVNSPSFVLPGHFALGVNKHQTECVSTLAPSGYMQAPELAITGTTSAKQGFKVGGKKRIVIKITVIPGYNSPPNEHFALIYYYCLTQLSPSSLVLCF